MISDHHLISNDVILIDMISDYLISDDLISNDVISIDMISDQCFFLNINIKFVNLISKQPNSSELVVELPKINVEPPN